VYAGHEKGGTVTCNLERPPQIIEVSPPLFRSRRFPGVHPNPSHPSAGGKTCGAGKHQRVARVHPPPPPPPPPDEIRLLSLLSSNTRVGQASCAELGGQLVGYSQLPSEAPTCWPKTHTARLAGNTAQNTHDAHIGVHFRTGLMGIGPRRSAAMGCLTRHLGRTPFSTVSGKLRQWRVV